MRRTTHVSEVSVLEHHEAIVARMPRSARIADTSFELAVPGHAHRLVGRVVATRFEGRWRRGRRSGRWRLDALPAGPYGTLVSVVIEGWRRRRGEDVAFRLARCIRDRIEGPVLGARTDAAELQVPATPVWETART